MPRKGFSRLNFTLKKIMKTPEELLEQKIYELTEPYLTRDSHIANPAPIVKIEKGNFGTIGFYMTKKYIKTII